MTFFYAFSNLISYFNCLNLHLNNSYCYQLFSLSIIFPRNSLSSSKGEIFSTIFILLEIQLSLMPEIQKIGIRPDIRTSRYLDQLCNSLTSVKTDVEELKESLSVNQNDIDQRFSNINEKVQSLEKVLSSTKEDVSVIQTKEPTWTLEICRKLVDLEDKSRRNNLRILGIKEDPQESWEECENKIYDLLEEKLEIETSNITIERAHHVGEKLNNKKRAIAAQF